MIYRCAFPLKGAWLWRDLPVPMSSLCLDLENSVQVLSFPLHPCFTAPWWRRHLTYGAGDWRPLVDNSILLPEVVLVSMLWWLLEPRNVNKETCFWNPSHMTNITFAQNTTKLESCAGVKKKTNSLVTIPVLSPCHLADDSWPFVSVLSEVCQKVFTCARQSLTFPSGQPQLFR